MKSRTKKILIIFLSITIILFLYIFLINSFRNKFFQISLKSNGEKKIPITLPLIEASRGWYIFNPLYYSNNLNFLKNSSLFITSNGLITLNTFSPGLYFFTFSISGFTKLVITEGDEDFDADLEENIVDFNVDWRIKKFSSNNCDNNNQECITVIPAFSNNRTMGPENVNTYSTYINIDTFPCYFVIEYQCNEEPHIEIENYTIDNFNFSLKNV